MPRAKVPPGRSSKRSASSASSWRTPNLSCWATSASPSPRASLAAASSAPTPRAPSVIFPSLQLAELFRAGKAPPQLRGVALLYGLLAALALDAQREPQRLRVRRHQLVVALDHAARFRRAALAVADLRQLQQRDRLVRIGAQRALEEVLGVLRVLQALTAQAGHRVRARRRRVQRVAHRVHEERDRFALARGLAQEPAVIVVDLRLVGRQAQRALEVLLGERVLLQLHVDQPVEAVGGGIARVGRDRDAQLLERDVHVAAVVVQPGELGVQLGAVARVAHLADDRPALGHLGLAGAGGEQREDGEARQAAHARTSFSAMRRALRRVRSATSPASWPQAAAMSSPRVLRVVTVTPARLRISAKRLMRSGSERRNSESGNGLNGIRLYLQRTRRAMAASSRACSGASFTPSSMTYSKVTKSRGALSR